MVLNRGTINSPATPVNLSSSRVALRRVKKSRRRREEKWDSPPARAFNPSLARSHPSRGRNLLHSALKSIDNATKITGEREKKKEKEINSQSRVLFLRFEGWLYGAWSFSEMITLWRRIYITVNGVAKKGEKRKGGKYKKETENGTMKKTGKRRSSIFCCHRCSANVFWFIVPSIHTLVLHY